MKKSINAALAANFNLISQADLIVLNERHAISHREIDFSNPEGDSRHICMKMLWVVSGITSTFSIREIDLENAKWDGTCFFLFRNGKQVNKIQIYKRLTPPFIGGVKVF